MRLVVLGSSGGYPGPGLPCSGYLLEIGNARFWIDAGSGTLAELHRRCALPDLDAIFVSHLHADHWTDLPLAVHTLGFLHPEVEGLPVFGPPGFVDACGITLRWRLEDESPVFEPRELHDGLRTEVAGALVEAIAVEHSDLETFGLRFTADGLTFAYSADTGPAEALVALARDADLFLCEAGGTEDSPMHLTPSLAGAFASRAGAKRLALTHLDPDADHEVARDRAATAFDGAVVVARQGLVLDIGTLS